MQSMRSMLAFVGLVCTAPGIGCTRTTAAPPAVSRDDAAGRSVFTDTAVYRRFCVVPAGRSVNLEQPCLLLDQGVQPVRRPPRLIP